jgi:pyruvate dehydrogenase E2 component (dihydrolipoamide acetyltransferase)
MSIEIKMPQLGQTTDEVKILKWLVEEGQEVKRGQPICEVETDKATMELESFENGIVLKIDIEPDTIVRSGTVIAIIGKSIEMLEKDKNTFSKIDITKSKYTGEKITAEKESQTGLKTIGKDKPENKDVEENIIQPEKLPAHYSSEVKATSLVKNIAKNKSIDLRLIKGTGPNGLITRDDLENYGKTSLATSRKDVSESSLLNIAEINLSQSQIAVARNLTKSKSEIPHYYLKSEIFADNVLAWLEKSKNPDGSKVSIYSVLIFAVSKVLKQIPMLNGYFKDNKIILHKEINIGFAVAAGEELFVPVIKNADCKEIFEIDR